MLHRRCYAAVAIKLHAKSSFQLLLATCALLVLSSPVYSIREQTHATIGGTAYVSQAAEEGSTTLIRALKDSSIQHIIAAQDAYNARSEFEAYQGRPLEIYRNITITGSQGTNTILDLDFVASAIQLCPTCQLTFANITIANERHGMGEALDFVVGRSGSRAAVLFNNSNKLRLACSSGDAAAAVVQEMPRSRKLGATGGKQQTTLLDTSYKGTNFPASLHLTDVQIDVPHETVEGWRGGAGGYVMVANNVTRLCYNTITPSCLAKSTPEACIVNTMDELRQASGQGNEGMRKSQVGIAVGVSIAGACVIAGAIGAACMVKKRRSKTKKKHDSKSRPSQGQLPSIAQSDAFASSANIDQDFAEAMDESALRMFDSFIEGCNFVRAPLGVRKGWEVSKVLTSPYNDLTPSNDRKDIQLGQFLGAGSFGRVYRASWGGRDVAVKVIEHNSDASSAVESEVELMFKFSNHPNIVRAFYAITYTQNNTPSVPPFFSGTASSSSHNYTREAQSATANLHSSGGSSSNRLGFGSSGSGQRAALARLRSIPLQEIVMEESPGHTAAAAGSAAAGSSTPEGRDVITLSWQPPLERIDSDPAGDHEQQQQDRLPGHNINPSPTPVHDQTRITTASPPHTATALGKGVFGSTASSLNPRNVNPSFAGSNVTVQGSSLGESMDCVSRVYTWMGSSGSPVMPHPVAAGKNGNGNGADPAKEKRAETWLVQEFCDCGTLGSIVSEWNLADETDDRMLQRLLLLRDAAQGLRVLHSMNTVHGDLTARNVLVCSSKDASYGMVAKLADLGLSRVIKMHRTHRTTNTVGTLSHMPPELLRYGHCSTAVDIYAFGVMMWELYTNKPAFNKLQYGQFYETVVLRNLRPLIPPGMPADYSLLMQHCWASDPMQRPNVDRVLHCLNLMINERQQRLSELTATAATRVQSAPLPLLRPPPRYPTGMPHQHHGGAPHAYAAAAAGEGQLAQPHALSAPSIGVAVRHRYSYPGPPGRGAAAAAALPVFNTAAAAAVAQDATAAAVHQHDSSVIGNGWNGPPSAYSWGDRSGGIGCSTPLRPPLPLLRCVSSDDYGTDLGHKEEMWFV